MNMDGRQAARKTEPAQKMEQDDRITTAGEPDTKVVTRGQAGSEEIADPARQVS